MITITVRGPGGVISHEMSAIKQLFEELGVQVNIVDDHPPNNYYFDRETYKARFFKEPVSLIADHLPWGG